MTHYDIDFFKEFSLKKPISGIVERIVDAKGFRHKEEWGYSYQFNTDSSVSCVYKGEAMSCIPGLYKVLDICYIQDHICERMIWNNYLFVLEEDGTVYPVAEFIDDKDSSWVKKAMPVVKSYFNGEEIEPIELSKFKKVRQQEPWSISHK